MTVVLLVLAAVVLVTAIVFGIVRLLAHRVAQRDQAEREHWETVHKRHAPHGGTVVKFQGYDQRKAVEGFARSRRETSTGRPLGSAARLLAKRRRARPTSEIVSIEARRRAGGDRA